MNNEFVPYQESLELKNLGFDEPCFGLYKEDSYFLYADVFSFREPYSPSEFKEGVDKGVCYINSEILEELVTAPTFSQAFRWFREKHNLFSICFPALDFWVIEIKKLEGIHGNPVVQGYPDIEYDTYEEAELACLKNLIEIIKNQ